METDRDLTSPLCLDTATPSTLEVIIYYYYFIYTVICNFIINYEIYFIVRGRAIWSRLKTNIPTSPGTPKNIKNSIIHNKHTHPYTLSQICRLYKRIIIIMITRLLKSCKI